MWWEVRGYGRLHGSGPGWFVPLWGIQAPGLHSKHLSKEPNWSIIMRYYKGQFQKFYSGTNNMYKNSTKSSRKTYTFTWKYQEGTGTNLNHQLLIVSVIQLFCSSDAQYWPALIGCLAAICNVIGWGLVGPGGRAQPRMEPCTSGHQDTNKVARVRDILDFNADCFMILICLTKYIWLSELCWIVMVCAYFTSWA